jgi:glutathione synthase/RimK-type ligase-like ATP-grasp enzyme
MWHFHHTNSRDYLFAKNLIYSIQKAGKTVFPDTNTAWHFDDKAGQKYLLESLKAPLVPSYIFYEKEKALEWSRKVVYPKVFKLRNGAGSENVRLVEDEKNARSLIKQAFGKGFSQYEAATNLAERVRKFRNGTTGLFDVFKGVIRLGYTTDFNRIAGNEKGYIYFQDFIPGNDHDIRVVVIGDKAFAIKRMVRKNDFRASGSGEKYTERELFKEETIQLAFRIAKKLKTQCVAFDFIYDNGNPKLLELSYGFMTRKIRGYWDSDLNWYDEEATPPEWMIENLLHTQSV